MGKPNPVFKKNYENYLHQLEEVNPANWSSILAIEVDREKRLAKIPFFDDMYDVSPTGISDAQGSRPDYGISVILLKYLLMCPQVVPTDSNWVHSRDFKDTVQAQNTGMSDFASQKISKLFAGNLDLLKLAVSELGGKVLVSEFPYDLSAILYPLPRVPVIFLFNDQDEDFPAKTSILYESRAHHFLDAECRVMVDWYLLEKLKKIKRRYSA
ncbi:MAG: DUF3786 domain-containing protein [Desulfocapsaceae bacterium]|nr:DUF3786 domain-containing protein [Desulfocapsaceae bacterium]